MQRMWINQPSSLQPLHSLHGTNVLGKKWSVNTYCVYFLSGDLISQYVPATCLSNHWLPERNTAMTPERAAELLPIITAFAAGKAIQTRYKLNDWRDLSDPRFDEISTYRVKPDPKWYRVAELFGCDKEHFTQTADSSLTEEDLQSYPTFVRWLTDKVYYEA